MTNTSCLSEQLTAGGSKQSAQDVAGGADHKVRDLETRLASTERSLKTLELLKRSG